MIFIDCTAMEDEVAKNMYQWSELDYLIYNDPLGYADLVLNGDPEEYLKNVTDYSPWTNGKPPVQTPCGVGAGGLSFYTV